MIDDVLPDRCAEDALALEKQVSCLAIRLIATTENKVRYWMDNCLSMMAMKVYTHLMRIYFHKLVALAKGEID